MSNNTTTQEKTQQGALNQRKTQTLKEVLKND